MSHNVCISAQVASTFCVYEDYIIDYYIHFFNVLLWTQTSCNLWQGDFDCINLTVEFRFWSYSDARRYRKEIWLRSWKSISSIEGVRQLVTQIHSMDRETFISQWNKQADGKTVWTVRLAVKQSNRRIGKQSTDQRQTDSVHQSSSQSVSVSESVDIETDCVASTAQRVRSMPSMYSSRNT